MIFQASLSWKNWLWPLKNIDFRDSWSLSFDSFFWGSSSRRAQETTMPEFANQLAGERAAMWHALGATRALCHHDLTFFSAIQRWAGLAFHAKGACGHLFLPFFWICGSHSDCQQVLTAASLKFIQPARGNFTPSLQHTTNIHHLFSLLCDQLVTRGALGKIWISFGYRFGYHLRGHHLCKSHARETEWFACCSLPKLGQSSTRDTAWSCHSSMPAPPANRRMASAIWATRCLVQATHLA